MSPMDGFSRDGWATKTWTNKLTFIFVRFEKGRRKSILSAKWSHCHLSLSLAGEVSTGKFCRRSLLSHSQKETYMQCKFSLHSNPGVLSLLTKKSSSGLSCCSVSNGPLGANYWTQCLGKVTSGDTLGALEHVSRCIHGSHLQGPAPGRVYPRKSGSPTLCHICPLVLTSEHRSYAFLRVLCSLHP